MRSPQVVNLRSRDGHPDMEARHGPKPTMERQARGEARIYRKTAQWTYAWGYQRLESSRAPCGLGYVLQRMAVVGIGPYRRRSHQQQNHQSEVGNSYSASPKYEAQQSQSLRGYRGLPAQCQVWMGCADRRCWRYSISRTFQEKVGGYRCEKSRGGLFGVLAASWLLIACSPISTPVELPPGVLDYCTVEEPRRFTQEELDWRAAYAPWNLRRDFKTNKTWDRECDQSSEAASASN